jgi:predicted DNA-binding protein
MDAQPYQSRGVCMSELKPFLVRLRPEVAELLAKASDEQGRPQAAIVNDIIKDALSKHGDLTSRINRLLG